MGTMTSRLRLTTARLVRRARGPLTGGPTGAAVAPERLLPRRRPFPFLSPLPVRVSLIIVLGQEATAAFLYVRRLLARSYSASVTEVGRLGSAR
jgi:hypothetical protein